MQSMVFNFNVKSVSLLLFFGHALFFSLLLFIKSAQDENRSDKWLSCFMLLTALYIAPFMLGYAGWYAGGLYRDILFYTPFQQLFLLPPVLYFYVRSLLQPAYSFRKHDYWHFIPALIYGFYSLIVLVVDKWVLKDVFFYEDGRDKDFSAWYQLAGFLQMFIYLVVCLNIYKKYRKEAYDTLSYAESVIHRWMQRFLIAFLALLAIRLLYFIVNPEWAEFGKKFWYYISFSILIYYISVYGLVSSVKSVTRFSPYARGVLAVHPEPQTDPDTGIGIIIEAPPRVAEADIFGDSPEADASEQLSKEIIADLPGWKKKIEDLLEKEKVFENPLLTLSDLANRLEEQPRKVSRIINQGFAMNFNDLVNYYRVRAVVRKIEEGEENLHTILGLAFDCGFNSKSTFNRAFKKHTGSTPKELIRLKREKLVSNPDLGQL